MSEFDLLLGGGTDKPSMIGGILYSIPEKMGTEFFAVTLVKSRTDLFSTPMKKDLPSKVAPSK